MFYFGLRQADADPFIGLCSFKCKPSTFYIITKSIVVHTNNLPLRARTGNYIEYLGSAVLFAYIMSLAKYRVYGSELQRNWSTLTSLNVVCFHLMLFTFIEC